VPAALGVKTGPSTNAAVSTFESLGSVRLPQLVWPVVIVLVVAALMMVVPRIHKNLPASLIAIALVSIGAQIASLPVARIGTLPASLPAPGFPTLSWSLLSSLSGPTLTVAALAAIESLLSARVAASLADTGPFDADRELFGQGLASIASGMFGGMPATGAIARTAVNVRSGGRTRLAAITHSVVLIAVVYLATGPVSTIPLAALAGVLMVTAYRMVSTSTIRSIVGSTRSDTLVFFVTVVITVSFDLIVAVEIGIAVAAFFALRSLAKSGSVVREDIRGESQPGDERIGLLRFDGALFFGAAERVLATVNEIQGVEVVILRMSQLHVLDATGARVIADMIVALERRAITVLVKGVQERHSGLLTRVGAIKSLRHENHLFQDLDAAVEHARSHIRRNAGVRQ
jgi:sulfate permease, SulP family